MDKKEFTIEYLFTKYKDIPCDKRFLNELAQEYKLNKEEITELRAKWIKYQIDYYGEQIKPTYIKSYDGIEKLRNQVRCRKYYKKRKLGLK